MIIKPNTQEVVYITIHDTTFYIDYSLDEPIVEMWKKAEEIITLSPDTVETITKKKNSND